MKMVLTPGSETTGNLKFSVDKHVGLNKFGASSEDIFLVQYCLQLLRLSTASPVAKDIPLQSMSGRADDASMIEGIEAVQAFAVNTTPDGFCSPFSQLGYGPKGIYTLALIQGTLIRRNQAIANIWPRLDMCNLAQCPPDVGKAVRRELGVEQPQPGNT